MKKAGINKILFSFLLVLSLYKGKTQTNFYKTYGGLYSVDPACIIALPDSGCIIYSSDNSINPDQELRRLDKYGNVVWYKKMIYPITTERAGAITLSSKNHILIAGDHNSNLNVFRLDLNGNIVFKKVYSSSGAKPTKIAEDANGNIYVVGQYADIYKLDSTGILKWSKRYPQTNYIQSIIPVSANKIILVGSANAAVHSFFEDIVHLFIDSMGVLVNQKGFGTFANEYSDNAFMDSSKRIYTSIYQINYANKDTAVGLMCTDTMGNQLWTRLVKGNFVNLLGSALLKDNSFICYVGEPSGSNHLFRLLHFSNDGQILQSYSIPSSASFCVGNHASISAAADGGYFLMGADNCITTAYGLLKVGPNLFSSCKTTIAKNFWERKILLNELQYAYTASTLPSTASNSTYSLTTLTPTVMSPCTSTCNTVSYFLAPAGNICAGSTITFTNNGQNYSSSLWKVDGSAVATTSHLNFTFSVPGTHTITSVLNGACIDSMQQLIVVDSIPNPNFIWSKRLAQVKFKPAKYRNGTMLTWDFGDGTPPNTCYDTVMHNYLSTGIYTVCLTESNTCGTKQACKTVTISSDYANSFYWLYKNPSPLNKSQSGVTLMQRADGSYFLAGSDDSYTSTGHGLLNLLDSAGNLKRSKILPVGGGYVDCSTQTSEGGSLVSGTAQNATIHMFGKVDSSVTAFSARSFSVSGLGTDRIGNNIQLPDGRAVFSGGINSQGYIILTRKNMTVQFFRTYAAFKAITAIRKAPSGCFYVYGNNTANLDPVLMKMDSLFNVLWIKQYDLGTTSYLTTDMQISPNEKLYLTGSYNLGISPSAFIMGLDSSGNSIFAANYKRTTPGNVADYGRTLLLDKKGNIFVNSYYLYANGGGGLIKIDSIGNAISTRSFSMSTFRLLKTYDNGISIAGSYKGGPTSSAAYSVTAIKMDSSATTSCWGSVTLTKTILTPTITSLSTSIFTANPVFSTFFSAIAYNASDTLLCGGPLLVTAVTSFEKNNSVKVFPNPATSEVSVVCETEDILTIEVINSLGQKVFETRRREHTTIIDMRQYEPGIYFIKTKNKDGTTVNTKIIKLN